MTSRILTGAVLLVLLFLALFFGGWVFSVLWTACVCIALYEIFHALYKAQHRPVAWPTWAALLIAIPGFLYLTDVASLLLLVVLVAVTTFIVSALVMFREEPKLEDLCMSLLPLFMVVIPAMSFLGMTRIQTIGLQRVLLCLSFFIPVAGDSLAFFVGSKYGRRKLNEAISPKKTVEGALAGLFGSVIIAIVIYLIGKAFNVSGMPHFISFIILGLLGGITGQIGDLLASFVKRHCGLKDFGHIFPGHGGMLDRLDSILLSGTLVYLFQALPWI